MPTSVAIADTILSVATGPSVRGDVLSLAGGLAGLYRSSGAYQPWQRLNPAFPGTVPESVSSVTIALVTEGPAVKPVVFAGSTGAVWRSLDDGDSWSSSALPEPTPVVSVLAASPAFARDRVLYAGTEEDGVLRSGDGGATWESWNFGLFDRHVFALAVSPDHETDGIVFAGTQTGLFQSGNGGRSWQKWPFPVEETSILSLAIAPKADGNWLLCAGTEGAGLFISRDLGYHWSYACAAGQNINAVESYPNARGGFDILAATEEGVLAAHDGEESWHGWGPPVRGVLCMTALSGLVDGTAVLAGLAERGVLWLAQQED